MLDEGREERASAREGAWMGGGRRLVCGVDCPDTESGVRAGVDAIARETLASGVLLEAGETTVTWTAMVQQ